MIAYINLRQNVINLVLKRYRLIDFGLAMRDCAYARQARYFTCHAATALWRLVALWATSVMASFNTLTSRLGCRSIER